MTDPIQRWAERYGDELDKTLPQRSLAAQRARILLARPLSGRKNAPQKMLFAFVGVGLLLAGISAFFLGRGEVTLSVEQQPQLAGAPVEVGAAIRAQLIPQELTFPQGSRVVWKESSQGSLSEYSEQTVELTLDSGLVELDVAHRAGRTWVVRAGDFRVYVVGTAFAVDYNRASGAIEVRVTRGRVRVEGPRIGAERLTLEPGERFFWTPQTEESRRIEESRQIEEARQNGALSVPAEDEERGTNDKASEQRVLVPSVSTKDISWQELARQGKYDFAIAKAELQGVDKVISKASPDDQVLLGNAARYSGRVELANRAYKSARLTAGPAATLAAYYLAKTALDTGGNSGEAIRWLRIYLKEAERGELASSARARLMSLLEGSGDHVGARAIAKEYVALHPQGPHLQTAKMLLKGR